MSTDSTADGDRAAGGTARLLVLLPWDTESDAATKPAADANKELAFIVPGVPESNEAFLSTPVGLQTLESKRVAGGMRVVSIATRRAGS